MSPSTVPPGDPGTQHPERDSSVTGKWRNTGLLDLPDTTAAFDELGPMCGETDTGDACTRKASHQGRHVALGEVAPGVMRVLAAWPGTHAPTIADLGGALASRVHDAILDALGADHAHEVTATVEGGTATIRPTPGHRLDVLDARAIGYAFGDEVFTDRDAVTAVYGENRLTVHHGGTR